MKAKLKSPLLISLAISKYVASINWISSLRIPTPTGIMEVDDVYYCKGIFGSVGKGAPIEQRLAAPTQGH
jgi:hypothetical protein